MTPRLMLRSRRSTDGGGIGSGAGIGRVGVGLARRRSVAAVFGGASIVLLVAGQDLVLDELDDVGQRELFPANAAGQSVAANQLWIG